MRYLVVSDIHGSMFYGGRIPELFEREQADELILLGDLYYHGPRNPLPEDYRPMDVSKMLNGMKDKLVAIRGNCDAEVDEMISEFPFNDHVVKEIACRKFFFTHGHHVNIDNAPDEEFDAVIYGHFHTGFIKVSDGKIYANAGSMSLPKNDTAHSYIVIDDDAMALKDIDGEIIEKINLSEV